MGERFGRALGGILVAVARLGGQMLKAGAGIIGQLWNGIASEADWPKEKFSGVVQGVRNMLPFSSAKAGPLRDTHKL